MVDNPTTEEVSAHESLTRRLQFAGDSRYFAERLFSSEIFRGKLNHTALKYAPRTVDLLMNVAYDTVESLRLRRPVPHLGDARAAALSVSGRLEQHPRFLGFWKDAGQRSSVGLHIGVDLIRNRDKYFVVELNLDAALRPTRRELYDERIDPIVVGILEEARDSSFQQVVLCHRDWNSQYAREISEAGATIGIDATAAGCPYLDGSNTPLVALPNPLEEDTLYVFFQGRHTALDHYINDKEAMLHWLGNELERDSSETVAMPMTSTCPVVPSRSDQDHLPNVVIKMSGSERGRRILMGRFSDASHLASVLDVQESGELPVQFRSTYRQRVEHAIFREGVPLYQEFIPSECDGDGHPFSYRVHLVVTPTFQRFLSAHVITSLHPVSREPLPLGLIDAHEQYRRGLRNPVATGGFVFSRPSEAQERELKEAGDCVARAIARGIEKKFVVSD